MYEILVNPGARSGKGLGLWEDLETVFKSHKAEYRVNFTNYFGEEDNIIPDLYEEYKEKGEELHLLVMGGDGTINCAINKLPSFDNVKVSVIPLGSGNDLVRDLGFKGSLKDMATKLLENPEERLMDVGLVHCENSTDGEDPVDRRFIVSTGFGYDAAICEEVMRSGAKTFLNKIGLGKLIYLIVALKQLAGSEWIDATLTVNDKIISLKRFLFACGMNHRYEGGGFMFGPEANDNDGLLEVCHVAGISKPKVLQILPTAFKGEHFKFDGVDHNRASSFQITASIPLWVHTDGEVIAKADSVKVDTLEKVLKFVY